MAMTQGGMLTVAETARRLGLKEGTVRMWISRRRLAHLKIGRAVRVPEEEVERIIRENTIPAHTERYGHGLMI